MLKAILLLKCFLCFHCKQVKLAPLLARANLLVTRDIEWANLMLGFEQVKILLASHLPCKKNICSLFIWTLNVNLLLYIDHKIYTLQILAFLVMTFAVSSLQRCHFVDICLHSLLVFANVWVEYRKIAMLL